MKHHYADAGSPLPAALAVSGPRALRMKTADGKSITCYQNLVPDFVEAELERLYGSLFSSLPQLRVYGGIEDVNTYVVDNGTRIVTLWLFRLEAGRVHVLNEAITVGSEDMRRFAAFIFSRYPAAQVLLFNAIAPLIDCLPFPFQRFNCTEDSVLILPATTEEYLARLGKATRRNIKRYSTRLKEGFPSFRYRVSEGVEIDEREIRDIIALNRTRMARKNKVSGIDALEEERIVRLARSCGFIGVATIGGKVCAGAVVYRIGDNYFSFVRAHDPAFDAYRLGIVCAYALVSECIARNGRELHFMWGREGHKSLLAGVQRDFDQVTVYRSWHAVIVNAELVAKNIIRSGVRQARLWMLQKAREDDGVLSDLVRALTMGMRRLKCMRRPQH
jgi:hypothetical protein